MDIRGCINCINETKHSCGGLPQQFTLINAKKGKRKERERGGGKKKMGKNEL